MTTNDRLRKVEKGETLVERVISQIQGLVLSGEFAPGHRLPAERQLGQSLGVSRTVVRESLAALTAKGLIESNAGGGFTVAIPTSKDLIPSLTLFLRSGEPYLDYDRVHEVRRILEVEIAGLAAERRNDKDLADLEASVSAMKAIQENFDVEVFANADVEFHTLLAKATHNPLLWLLMETVADTMRDVRRIGSRVPGNPGRAIRHHSAILRAVSKADAPLARSEMREHLSESYNTMKRAIQS